MKQNRYIENNKRNRIKKAKKFKDRVTLLILTFVIVISTFTFTNAFSKSEFDTKTVVVKSGSTLWSIASEIDSNRDIREIIYEIQEINNIDSANIKAGQVIEVPLC